MRPTTGSCATRSPVAPPTVTGRATCDVRHAFERPPLIVIHATLAASERPMIEVSLAAEDELVLGVEDIAGANRSRAIPDDLGVEAGFSASHRRPWAGLQQMAMCTLLPDSSS